MGINARIETERGESPRELVDPRGFVGWLLSLAKHDGTMCLQFVDPYGDTVFNGLQLPMLRRELKAIGASLTEADLEVGKRDYMMRASSWPTAAVREASQRLAALEVGDLRGHLASLLDLVDEAIRLGPHHYVRFVGD
jgi:hypothetical protein